MSFHIGNYEASTNITINYGKECCDYDKLDKNDIVEKLNQYYKKGYLKLKLSIDKYIKSKYNISIKLHIKTIEDLQCFYYNDPEGIMLYNYEGYRDKENQEYISMCLKFSSKYFNLVKVSLKDLLINNNIPIIQNQKYIIKIDPDRQSYSDYAIAEPIMDNELEILISSLFTCILDNSLVYYSINIDDYNYGYVEITP